MNIFLPHLFATLIKSFVGLIGSVFIGFSFFLLTRRFRWADQCFSLFFIVFQTLPLFVLAPLILLCFGFSFWSITIPSMIALSLPILESLKKGFNRPPKEILFLFKLQGASSLKLFFSVELPYASSNIFSGLKIAAISSSSAALAGEWIGAQEGLGVLLHIFRRQYDIFGVATTLICVFAITLLLFTLISLLENLFCYEKKIIKSSKNSSSTPAAKLQ